MNIVFVDRETMGASADPMGLAELGAYKEYPQTNKNQMVARCKQAHVIVTTRTPVDRAIMDQCPNLQLIVACAVGVNHIDVPYCQEKGILVKNCPSYSTQTVAQHTVAMVLQLARNSKAYDQWIREDRWRNDLYVAHAPMPIEDIHQHTWGIIGLGNIGKKVAQLATGFGCKVVYYSTTGKNHHAEYPQVDLQTLIQSSQIVSLHCPLTPQTRHLLNHQTLQWLQPQSILINVARGDVLDEEALVQAYHQKQLRLGLDVVSSEPLSPQSPLYALRHNSDVIITPHVAWTSKQARDLLTQMVRQHIQRLQAAA
jgi:glycerate dehydrogenase